MFNEYVTQLLTEKINEYNTIIKAIDELLAVLQKYDNQVMNKRIVNAVNSNQTYHMRYVLDGEHHDLSIRLRNSDDTKIVHVYNVERGEVVVNKRLNYKKLADILVNNREWYVNEIHKIMEDLDTGEQRLIHYNDMVKQLNELYDGFSSTFQSKLGMKFHNQVK